MTTCAALAPDELIRATLLEVPSAQRPYRMSTTSGGL